MMRGRQRGRGASLWTTLLKCSRFLLFVVIGVHSCASPVARSSHGGTSPSLRWGSRSMHHKQGREEEFYFYRIDLNALMALNIGDALSYNLWWSGDVLSLWSNHQKIPLKVNLPNIYKVSITSLFLVIIFMVNINCGWPAYLFSVIIHQPADTKAEISSHTCILHTQPYREENAQRWCFCR